MKQKFLNNGIGICLTHSEYLEQKQNLPDVLQKFDLIVVKSTDMEASDLTELASIFGKIITMSAEDKSGDYAYGAVLQLDGDDTAGKVVTGAGMLPLHTDGLLTGAKVDINVLHCLKKTGDPQSGATLICDQRKAWGALPEELRHLVSAIGLEYIVVESGYFPNEEYQSWCKIDAMDRIDGQDVLNIALPFDKDNPPAWKVRIAGHSIEKSEELLRLVAEHFLSPEFTYSHNWESGDLMIFNNRKTLHGRSRIFSGERKLQRVQIEQKREV